MTTARAFLWDTSSHDDTPTSRDAIDVFGCKLTDGNRFYLNPTFAAKMNAMRGFGVDTFFAYHVLWGGGVSVDAQAAWFLERLDAILPWWDDPGITFMVMSDDEPFGYNTAPTVPTVNAWHQSVVAQSGGRLTMAQQAGYLPQWYYGQAVAGLTVKWWQSNYGSNPIGPYRDVYPGDNSPRWTGPRHIDFLQYGSNTIIAGQTTSDASAYAGTLADLKKALGAIMADSANVKRAGLFADGLLRDAATIGDGTAGDGGYPDHDGVAALDIFWAAVERHVASAVKPRLDAIDAALAALSAKIDALPSGADHTHSYANDVGPFPVSGQTGPPQPPAP